MTKPERVHILGIQIDAVTYESTLDWVETAIKARKPQQIVTVNPEMLVLAQHNAKFRAVLTASNLNIPDGAGLIVASALTGRRIKSAVTGTDLLEKITHRAAKKEWRLMLLGAGHGVAAKAAYKLKEKYPSVNVEYLFVDPNKRELSIALHRVHSFKPDVLCVAFGAPKQDLWIAEHKAALKVPVSIGVGGALDFISGNVPRAPRLMRKLGFEWLWRLLVQPRRWKRIWNAVVVFPWLVLTHHKKQGD